MLEQGFHVHGPHDHELEQARQEGQSNGGMINQIAMFTAIIATIGAIFSYMAGSTQSNAGMFKNNAAITKTEAANQWNFFQAKGTKQSLAELAHDLAPKDKQAILQTTVDRYEKEKIKSKLAADKLEAEATQWEKASDEQMRHHHRWAQATTVLQVAIALAAIALMTKKKWLEFVMFGVGGAGLVVGVTAAFHF